MPEEGKQFMGEIVTIVPIGGFGYAEDDVIAILKNRIMLYLKENQLEIVKPV